MSKEATREYVVRTRIRYGAMTGKRAKGRVLDEFCATTGLERKHAIKVLRAPGDPAERRGRTPTYGPDEYTVLREVWMRAGQPCSKLMRPVMDGYVKSYELACGALEEASKEKLLKISESSIDRLLSPARTAAGPRRKILAGVAAVRREVPIRAGEWSVAEPGWIEADTVAHCGGSMAGNFVWTLTATDILTQWTEVRSMWNRGAAATFERLREIEEALPFGIVGFDSDNGPEFMNWHLLNYFRAEGKTIEVSRSRPYQKNDNAHVEQKNGTHVRGLLGHVRIDDPECVEPLNQAMVLWSLWKNLYAPVRRLTSKTKEGGRYKKRYDKARTPAQRALECAMVPEERKAIIRRWLDETDCFAMKKQVDRRLEEVFAAIRSRANQTTPVCPPPETSALRAAPSGSVSSRGQTGMNPSASALNTPKSTQKTNKRLVS